MARNFRPGCKQNSFCSILSSRTSRVTAIFKTALQVQVRPEVIWLTDKISGKSIKSRDETFAPYLHRKDRGSADRVPTMALKTHHCSHQLIVKPQYWIGLWTLIRIYGKLQP